ncbi:MAG: FAD:protein FMN transferase [Caldilineales bacterium]|nr:FAD:protein FMN transferase [Caldilineales bacterium]
MSPNRFPPDRLPAPAPVANEMATHPGQHTHRFRAMNCEMMATVYSDHPQAPEALRGVELWMQQVEAELSRFRADSDLSRLNRATGNAYHAGDILWEVTLAAVDAAVSTAGLFDPTVGQTLIAAGYDRSFEQLGDSDQEKTLPSSLPDYHRIELDTDARTILIPDGLQLDLGGIAKGWAADKALEKLSAFGPALIDAGGDLAIGAPPPATAGWLVAIADPLTPEQDVALLQLSQCGLATSGTDHRKWRVRGRQQHHLIDPRLGTPAPTNILNSTVIAATATEADVLALTLTILDTGGVQTYLSTHTELPILLVLNDGSTYQTHTLATHVVAYHPRYA